MTYNHIEFGIPFSKHDQKAGYIEGVIGCKSVFISTVTSDELNAGLSGLMGIAIAAKIYPEVVVPIAGTMLIPYLAPITAANLMSVTKTLIVARIETLPTKVSDIKISTDINDLCMKIGISKAHHLGMIPIVGTPYYDAQYAHFEPTMRLCISKETGQFRKQPIEISECAYVNKARVVVDKEIDVDVFLTVNIENGLTVWCDDLLDMLCAAQNMISGVTSLTIDVSGETNQQSFRRRLWNKMCQIFNCGNDIGLAMLGHANKVNVRADDSLPENTDVYEALIRLSHGHMMLLNVYTWEGAISMFKSMFYAYQMLGSVYSVRAV